MYSFIDVKDVASASLPSEALKINGDYIENQIPGYRTLYVSGREAISQTLDTYEIGCSHGSKLNGRRYPSRTIVVGYQLIAESTHAFREAYNTLASILDVENAELIFADEPDKFFIGTPSSVGDIEPGRNAVKGELEFTCLDPFKYSVNEYEVVPSEDEDTFLIDYNGNFPAYPTIECDFYADESGEENNNGRCGYIAFYNDREKILQFGNPEELAEEAIQVVDTTTNTYLVPDTKVLLNHSFVKSNGWSSLSSKYTKNGGVIYKSHTKTGSLKAQKTTSSGIYYVTGDGFGSGTGYHGPTATYTFSESATDFDFYYKQKICCGSDKADKKQRGGFQMILSDSSGTIVAGVDIFKNDEGTKGKYRMIVNGTVMKEADLDLSYHNKYFGNNRSENKKKKITAINTVKSSSITKSGNKISFNLGGITQTFIVDAVKSKAVNKVTFMFSNKKTYTSLVHNGLYEIKLVKNYQRTVTNTVENIRTEYHDVQNKFNANDVLVADCAAGSVKLNDLERPDLGALGNDWEDFYLQSGVNQIGCSYSEWVEDAYSPSFKLKYREVFL